MIRKALFCKYLSIT